MKSGSTGVLYIVKDSIGYYIHGGVDVCLCTGNPVRAQRKATGSTEENNSVVHFEIHSSYITNTDHHPLSKS